MRFEWDEKKDAANREKHGLAFDLAKEAFFDAQRITTADDAHSSEEEQRYFCFGRIKDKIATVRFTLREGNVRILGAGYWRKGKRFYEEKNGH
ncbi:MAG: BrnT family toxin [Rickettsiales bacterium]